MARCSIPRFLGFGRWFDARFADLCLEHDRLYTTRELGKWETDKRLFVEMKKRGYTAMACLAWLASMSPVGWWFWLRD